MPQANPCCRNLAGDPQGAGLRHPLAGMDAGVEPDGRAVGSSRAELGEKTDSSTSKSGKDSPSRALGCVVCVLHPPDTPCGFWRYLQDVQRAFLVGFPDLDLFHKAVLGCKVVQLLVNLQGEVMRTLKSYFCVLPFLPESRADSGWIHPIPPLCHRQGHFPPSQIVPWTLPRMGKPQLFWVKNSLFPQFQDPFISLSSSGHVLTGEFMEF